MDKQPTLTEALRQRAQDIKVAGTHSENGALNACRHNALLVNTMVEQACSDAGMYPLMLLMGVVAKPVIETGKQCSQCLENTGTLEIRR